MSDNNVEQDQFIKILKEEDRIFKEQQKLEQEKEQESKMIRMKLLEKQAEVQRQAMITSKLDYEKNNVLLQRYATEAAIIKNELDQIDLEMEEIDKQLAELTEKSKNRINKIADQFVLLNKQKNVSLAPLRGKSLGMVKSDDIVEILNNDPEDL